MLLTIKDISPNFGPGPHFLTTIRPDRDHQDTPQLQLAKQCIRNLWRSAGYDDPIEGTMQGSA
ncbi:MAG TPA: hypothetical protein PKL41_10045, partial [Flavobacteriales bacterium]|nr:hypothetical protein [Flavobacteriales bacterium]